MQLTNKWLDLTMASDSGTGDGSSVDYVVSNDLKTQNSVWVSVDGLLKTITSDYTVNVSTNTITFTTAPAVAQKINIKYIRG